MADLDARFAVTLLSFMWIVVPNVTSMFLSSAGSVLIRFQHVPQHRIWNINRTAFGTILHYDTLVLFQIVTPFAAKNTGWARRSRSFESSTANMIEFGTACHATRKESSVSCDGLEDSALDLSNDMIEPSSESGL